MKISSEIFDTSQIEINDAYISEPFEEMEQNKQSIKNTQQFKNLQKEKNFQELKLSPVKRPKTPENIKKEIHKINEWKYIDPQNLNFKYPQPIRGIQNILKKQILHKVYNYIILKQNSKFQNQINQEKCLIGAFLLDKREKEIFQEKFLFDDEQYSLWIGQNFWSLKNGALDIVKSIGTKETPLKVNAIVTAHQICLKFSIIFLQIDFDSYVEILCLRLKEKKLESVLIIPKQSKEDKVFIDQCLRLAVVRGKAVKIYKIKISQRLYEYFENKVKLEENEQIFYQTFKQELNEQDHQKKEENEEQIKEEKKEDQGNENQDNKENQGDQVQQVQQQIKQAKEMAMTIKDISQISFFEELNLPPQIYDRNIVKHEDIIVIYDQNDQIEIFQVNDDINEVPMSQRNHFVHFDRNNMTIQINEIDKDFKVNEIMSKKYNLEMTSFSICNNRPNDIQLMLNDGSIVIADVFTLEREQVLTDCTSKIQFFKKLQNDEKIYVSESQIVHQFLNKELIVATQFYDIHDYDSIIKKQFPIILKDKIVKVFQDEKKLYSLTSKNQMLIYDIEAKRMQAVLDIKNEQKIEIIDIKNFKEEIHLKFLENQKQESVKLILTELKCLKLSPMQSEEIKEANIIPNSLNSMPQRESRIKQQLVRKIGRFLLEIQQKLLQVLRKENKEKQEECIENQTRFWQRMSINKKIHTNHFRI